MLRIAVQSKGRLCGDLLRPNTEEKAIESDN